MEGLKDLTGKKIVIIHVSGFRKFGILKSSDGTGLVLLLNTGREEYIPMASVASVSLDLKE